MKLSEFIEQLERLRLVHGDIEIHNTNFPPDDLAEQGADVELYIPELEVHPDRNDRNLKVVHIL